MVEQRKGCVMSAPAAVLSQLSDLAVDGATVAALVLVALAGIKAFKLLRASIEDEVFDEAMRRTENQYTREELESGYLDSSGNLYATEWERDEAEMRTSEANAMTESEKADIWDAAVEQSRVEFNGEIDEDDAFESYNNSRMRPKAIDEDDAFEAYCNQRMTRN